MDIIIYLGIAINIIGAVLMFVFAIRYIMEQKKSGRLAEKCKDLRYKWLKKKAICLGMMVCGVIVAVTGCFI